MSRNVVFNVNLEDTSELGNIVESMIEEAVDGYQEEIESLKETIKELEDDINNINRCEC